MCLQRALKLQHEEHRQHEAESKKDKRSLKLELKELELAHEDAIRELKQARKRCSKCLLCTKIASAARLTVAGSASDASQENDKNVTKLRQQYEREVKELQQKYELKMKLLREDLELRRKVCMCDETMMLPFQTH